MIIIPLMRDYKKGKGVNIEEVEKEREGEIEEEKVTILGKQRETEGKKGESLSLD